MSIIESNKLIADFMGGKYIPDNEHVFSHFIIDGVIWSPSYVKYNSSWDWLMPVVVKCFDVYDAVEDNLSNHQFILNDALLETNIKSLYKAVVQFILWHNEQKVE